MMMVLLETTLYYTFNGYNKTQEHCGCVEEPFFVC